MTPKKANGLYSSKYSVNTRVFFETIEKPSSEAYFFQYAFWKILIISYFGNLRAFGAAFNSPLSIKPSLAIGILIGKTIVRRCESKCALYFSDD